MECRRLVSETCVVSFRAQVEDTLVRQPRCRGAKVDERTSDILRTYLTLRRKLQSAILVLLRQPCLPRWITNLQPRSWSENDVAFSPCIGSLRSQRCSQWSLKQIEVSTECPRCILEWERGSR